MKKLILNLAMIATTAIGSSALAWTCTARDVNGSAWATWRSPYPNIAEIEAINACNNYVALNIIDYCGNVPSCNTSYHYCVITSCY